MDSRKFNINDYCRRLEDALQTAFGERFCYMGLQGSHLRGEATEKSDIDIMVILDTLTVRDMDIYRQLLDRVGDSDRACGFICGRDDLSRWNPLEICQLIHTTADIRGTLKTLVPRWTAEDEANYIKVSLNNLYHALCHTYIHGDREKLAEKLLPHYKSAFFILQNTYFLENSAFVLTKAELTEKLRGEDKTIMETLRSLSSGEPADTDVLFARLFRWCREKQQSLP